MKKQAFLIIAHNEFALLQELVSALDNSLVDIFIHIDAKVKQMPTLSANRSKVYFVEERIDTRWGDVSQIETEYVLFKYAFRKEDYSYYHLISGTHFPLISITRILDYFQINKGKTICFDLCRSTKYQETLKLHRYNCFTKYLACGSKSKRFYAQRLWRVSLLIQEILHIYRNPGINFYKASNWISLPDCVMEYLIAQQARVMEIYRYTFCGDEYFIPTLLMNSEYKDSIISDNRMLYLKFGDANPRVLTIEDYDDIKDSGCLFARKFSGINMDVIDKIKKNLLGYES